MTRQADALHRVSAVASCATLSAVGGLVLLVAVNALPPVPLSSGRPIALRTLGAVILSLLVIGAWATARSQPLVAVGVALAGLGWLLPSLAAWSFLPDTVRAWCLAALPLTILGCAALTAGRWRHPAGQRLFALTAVLVFAACVIHALSYNPFLDPFCRWTCQEAGAPWGSGPAPHVALTVSVGLLVAAAACALGVVALSAAPPELLVTSALGLVAIGCSVGIGPSGWNGEGAMLTINTVQSVVVAAVGAAAIFMAIRSWRVRRAVSELLAQLAHPAADAGTDLVTGLQFTTEGTGWVDADGQPVTSDPTHALLLTDPSGGVTRVITARPMKAEDVLVALGPAGLLNVENSRRAAISRASLVEMQAARRRIIAAADTERHLAERDLHDGAQQRLVSVAFLLSPLVTERQGTDVRLANTQTQIGTALSALRTVAHGLTEADLDADSVGPALRKLAGGALVPVDVDLHPVGPGVNRDIARATFRAAAGALDDLTAEVKASEASVKLVREGLALVLVVRDDGLSRTKPGAALAHAMDWVEAVGGAVTIEAESDRGTIVTVRFPCAL